MKHHEQGSNQQKDVTFSSSALSVVELRQPHDLVFRARILRILDQAID